MQNANAVGEKIIGRGRQEMDERYLSESSILKEIKYYIDTDFYNYAVMIDGAWGSGKTYFVKNVLLKKIESNEKRVLYVSLYGISNIQELGKKLYLDYLLKDKSKLVMEHTELVENVIGTIIDIGSPFMGKLGDIDIKERKIKNIVQNAVKHICPMKNCVLIFDDLERCDCSIQDILGYINGFVEQAGMKVIIIANQEEFRKKIDAQTLAMQIRAVIGRDETLDFTEPGNGQLVKYLISMQNKQPENEKIKKVSLNVAKERVARVFGVESEYEHIREKIVGTVFYYNPDTKKVMSNLIQKNSTYNTNDRRQLEKNINYLAESMEKAKHVNFRTFQFFLQKMDKLLQVLDGEDYENIDFIYKRVILSCWDSCILFKTGKLKDDWNDAEYIEGVKFRVRVIEDYIKYSWLNVEKGKRVFKKFDVEETRTKLLKNDPVNLLQDKWYRADSDDFIVNNMNAVIENARKGIYDIGSYDRILQIFLQIHTAGFDIKYTDRLLEAMCEGIEAKRATGILDCIGTMSWESKKTEQLYKQYIRKLQEVYNKFMEKKSEDDLNIFLQEDNWAQKIYDYCLNVKHPQKQEDYTKKLSPFLKALDVKTLIGKLETSNGENLQKFASVLRLVYPLQYNPNAFIEDNEERKKLCLAMKHCKENETQLIRRFQYQIIEEYLLKFTDFEESAKE
ncbi:P-loop NTPase fold protein [Blautia faecis]|uniref:P-loop NTPase fold protein n=1 Tax=Blautia faecis TaxID=871665 RepID=UPI0022E43EAE|nr:P-loop NTPase fold protein [Blautia faecis]